MKLNLPSGLTTVLGLVAGVLAVLTQTTFGFPAKWASFVTVALVFLAGLGISPLVGSSFRSVLHLSQAASLVISSGLSALAVAVTTFSLSTGLKGILEGVLAFASALGFAPSIVAGAKLFGAGATPTGTVKRTGVGVGLLVLAVSGSLLVVLWVV